MFRIRIRSVPYHLAGSGSTSGNVDPDPGSKKIVINSHKIKINQNYKNTIFFLNNFFCLINMNYINYKNNIVKSIIPLTGKNVIKNWIYSILGQIRSWIHYSRKWIRNFINISTKRSGSETLIPEFKPFIL